VETSCAWQPAWRAVRVAHRVAVLGKHRVVAHHVRRGPDATKSTKEEASRDSQSQHQHLVVQRELSRGYRRAQGSQPEIEVQTWIELRGTLEVRHSWSLTVSTRF